MKVTIRVDGMAYGKPTARASDLVLRLVAEQQQRTMGAPRFAEVVPASDVPMAPPPRH